MTSQARTRPVINTTIDADLLKQVRKYCATHGTTISAFTEVAYKLLLTTTRKGEVDD